MIHAMLDKYRINSLREFFGLPIPDGTNGEQFEKIMQNFKQNVLVPVRDVFQKLKHIHSEIQNIDADTEADTEADTQEKTKFKQYTMKQEQRWTFIKKGMIHYGDKKLFIHAILNDSLPDHIPNTHQGTKTYEAVESWVTRANRDMKNFGF